MTHDLDVLMTAMTSSDPRVRDGWAYEELAQGIADGRFSEQSAEILEAAAARLSDPEPWTRSFAALVMTWLASAGTFTHESFAEFEAWYPTEPDTRGFDTEVGWIHAVAHGADYLGTLVRRRFVLPTQVLPLFSARMIGPGQAWTHQEDARIVRSILITLATCASVADATGLLSEVTRHIDAFESEAAAGKIAAAPPAWIHNTTMTCVKLHFALGLPASRERIDPAISSALTAGLQQTLVRIEPFIDPWPTERA